MFFISRKRFNEEVERRVVKEVELIEEHRWRDEMEREHRREMQELSRRLSIIEQALTGEAPAEEVARIGFQ